jgi:hypothetical protein
VLGLVGMLYVDQTSLSEGLKTVVRVGTAGGADPYIPRLLPVGSLPAGGPAKRAYQLDLPGRALAGSRRRDSGDWPIPGLRSLICLRTALHSPSSPDHHIRFTSGGSSGRYIATGGSLIFLLRISQSGGPRETTSPVDRGLAICFRARASLAS